MATVHLQGKPVHTNGALPEVGTQAPDFVLTNSRLKDLSLANFAGKKKLLNVVPSLDTGVCATSAKRFDAEAEQHEDSVFLTISADLPFAMARFCKAAGIDNVLTLSMLRSRDFATDYGVLLLDGPLAGLATRAVIVLSRNNMVCYTELLDEIAQEPDYAGAIAALERA